MKLMDMGKNGGQPCRLFNSPAQIYMMQHYPIGATVRKQAEAFALARSLSVPCGIGIIDGSTMAPMASCSNTKNQQEAGNTSREAPSLVKIKNGR